ncbi:MAG: GNAT family N-acetyltransferase [Bacteroidia bacterium]|nr:GNAT family N-acetyltransferase [Bacteroidia bacterium]
MITGNPFKSPEFVRIWREHFYDKPSKKLNFLKGIEFYRPFAIPLYVNIGKNLTKGLDYELDATAGDYRNKVFLIYDVPDYFDVQNSADCRPSDLGIKQLFQYKGYLMDLRSYPTMQDYMKNQFSKHNKRYIRWSHIKRLEDCFNISYRYLYGEVDTKEYALVFDCFYELLSKRFSGKGTEYHHLNSSTWSFYKDLIYPLIRNKKASFLVIYNEGIPIGINLNYHFDNILVKAITVFDTDYYKFSIGKLSVLKLLEWCYENNYEFSDFSKGFFDYKMVWANRHYNFNYHILYDKRSITAVPIAFFVEQYFRLKSYLRKKNINAIYRKLTYKLRRGRKTDEDGQIVDIEKLDQFTADRDHELLNLYDPDYRFLRVHAYTFLFSNPEPVENIRLFRHVNTKNYIVAGTSKAIQISLQS